MDERTMLAPLVIPKTKVQFGMTELCIQDEVCHLEIPSIASYNNYICMGDETDEQNMNCRMIRVDDSEHKTSSLDVTFRCKSILFESGTHGKNEPSNDINSCYYVGDNKVVIKEPEHDSVTDALACIRQKHACKLPYKFSMGKCHDDQCLSNTRAGMKKECNYKCA
jgi:hypothetical protein